MCAIERIIFKFKALFGILVLVFMLITIHHAPTPSDQGSFYPDVCSGMLHSTDAINANKHTIRA